MEDKRDQHKLQIWTQHEMISALLAGIVIGLLIGLAF
jgi:F0F1-type ATP synthase assembly protein I